jgi:hypothetical protein
LARNDKKKKRSEQPCRISSRSMRWLDRPRTSPDRIAVAEGVDQQPRRQDPALADVVIVDNLPRSAIGKVLKRELRDRRLAGQGSVPANQTSS